MPCSISILKFKGEQMSKSKDNSAKSIDKWRYKREFKKGSIREEALRRSYEIRQFEIELYWKRAAYFWAFIGATFVSYGVFYEPGLSKEPVLLVISCIGFVFSFAWVLVNKGSKFWQENWENHVDLLEDDINGPLYKTLLSRPKEKKESCLKAMFVNPNQFSVSKINQLVSVFILFVWSIILIRSLLETHLFKAVLNILPSLPSRCIVNSQCLLEIGMMLLTIFIICSFLCWGKTGTDKHTPSAIMRESEIEHP